MLTTAGALTRRLHALVMVMAASLPARALVAQPASIAMGNRESVVGSDGEAYMRLLQLAGVTESYPWGVRAFSPVEVAAMRATADRRPHPWQERWRTDATSRDVNLQVVPLSFSQRFNSAFPYGVNDGAIWAGKGLTTAVSGGAMLRFGVLSAALLPMAFRAENAPFALLANGDTGRFAFADGEYNRLIDRPQRFGNTAYQRADWGQSYVRLDAKALALGVSTGNEGLGPATRFPFLLGANAGGFPHAFIGTAHPVSMPGGRLHVRLAYGTLDQSDFFDPANKASSRLVSLLTASIEPSVVPGLEVGATRLFHEGVRGSLRKADFAKPFEGLFKKGLRRAPGDGEGTADSTNQLAAVFGRLVVPAAGVEVYVEFGREDHPFDVRDLILDTEHTASTMWGLGKVWRRQEDTRWFGARMEYVSAQNSRSDVNRGERAIYIHAAVPQGHTQRGQLLGTNAGINETSGAWIALDRYDASGRWTIDWSRTLQGDRGTFPVDGVTPQRIRDVLYTAGINRLTSMKRAQVETGVTAGYELNRNGSNDTANLSLFVIVRP